MLWVAQRIVAHNARCAPKPSRPRILSTGSTSCWPSAESQLGDVPGQPQHQKQILSPWLQAPEQALAQAPAPARAAAAAAAPAQPKEPPPACALGNSAPPYASACKVSTSSLAAMTACFGNGQYVDF